ncbi:MocR-like pyridoxine biosynthesis transcription factor PdxR [Acidiphilium iwatense]|uniref:MocR-like pyridoxine biosynthesis transcription factor PdxR n=1 Tax=Acidiphilium iwatense TaxID=768198 RepID=UPI0038B388F1
MAPILLDRDMRASRENHPMHSRKRSPPIDDGSPRPKPRQILWHPLFALDPRDDASLQLQIRRSLVTAILDKHLRAATRLPSSRALSRHLGVARNTVTLAYRQLVDEGFIVAHARSGYVVSSDVADRIIAKASLRQDNTAASSVRPNWSTKLSGHFIDQRNIQKPPDWYTYPYPFIYGQSDPALFPTADWRECSRNALAVLAIRDWSADMIDGDDAMLIEQLQQRILPRRGIFVAADQIMITIGAQHALYMLAELLVRPGKIVGIENPGYPDARNIFTMRGAALRALPLTRDGIAIDESLADCGLVYLTPSHQCPTSSTLPLATREALLDHAERHDMIIIEDDYESELKFDGSPTPALKSLDRSDRVVYVGSLSKSLAPGLRIGYVVGAPELITECRALRRLMVRHPPANNQRAAALFLALGHHDALIRRLTAVLAERAAVLAAALARHVPELRFQQPRGGSSLWIEGPEGLDTRRLAEAARRAGVLIEPGDVFFDTPPAPCPFFRLGYSSIAANQIDTGIRKLAALLHA